MRVLEASKLFANLSPEELKALQAAAHLRTFQPGEIIFREGEEGDGVYLIDEGEVQISAVLAGMGAQGVLSRLGPGEFFGEMAVLDDEPRSATVMAQALTSLYFIPRPELLKLLESSPRLGLNLVREFSRRLRDFDRQYLREALEAERLTMVGRFARSIVHDFKNPLNIIGIAAELASLPNASPDSRATGLQRIRKQVQRLTNMINELLEFTRGAQTPVALCSVRYPTFVRSLVTELEPELKEKGVTVVWAGDPPEVHLAMDPNRVSHVFYNLIQNAAEAMARGGTLTLRFQQTDTDIVTCVDDTGPGVARDILPRLFETFASFGKSQGAGLGLSICKKIVEDHGGRIEAENLAGGGARFRFTLPLARPAPPPAGP